MGQQLMRPNAQPTIPMQKLEEEDPGADVEMPDVPDFSRLPFRPAEDAEYRDPKDVPPHLADNPLYLALPGPRTMSQVQEIIKRGAPVFDPFVRQKTAAQRREWIDVVDPLAFPLP